MKKRRVWSVAGKILLGSSLLAVSAMGQTAGKKVSSIAWTPVAAELKSNLNTKNARLEDTVMAKTLAALPLRNGTVIPKGAILTGKVYEVQPISAGSGLASIMVAFDQVESTEKPSPTAIYGILVAIAPPATLSDGGPSTSSLPSPSGNVLVATVAPDNPNQGMASIRLGSSLHGVVLSGMNAKVPAGMLISKKDIKLDSGMRIGVLLFNK